MNDELLDRLDEQANAAAGLAPFAADALEDAADEIRRLRLTDSERDCIEWAWCSVGRDDAINERDRQRIRDTLEVLLERTK